MKLAADQGMSNGGSGAKRRRDAKEKGRRRSGGGGGGGGVVRRTRKRVLLRTPEPAPLLQRLFAACRDVFRGPGTVPAPDDVALIRAILDEMGPGDVNLSAEQKFFKATDDDAALQRPLAITRTTIYTCTNFSIVIFFLPPTAVIPLHNHPGMTVFSKLLLGSLHIKSYDWAQPAVFAAGSAPDDRPARLAEVVLDRGFSAPSDTLVLYPAAGGNMHRFTAATPCALLDVLGPPYSEDRDCTYYQDFPYDSHCAGDDIAQLRHGGMEMEDIESINGRRRLEWLKETAMPEDLEMYEMQYRGPPIL
uniref:cysteine dioxygenase n=1 Tax=Leersia perrieri TaxID=77586 RepID=A0A0D9VX13_9ORYZ